MPDGFNSSATPNRRSQTRLPVSALTCVELGEANGGIVVNISPGGLALTAAMKVPAENLTQLRIQLPISREWIDVNGQLCWNTESRKKAGFRFVDLSERDRRRIEEWIFRESSPREMDAKTAAIEGEPRKPHRELRPLSLKSSLPNPVATEVAAETAASPAPPPPAPIAAQPATEETLLKPPPVQGESTATSQEESAEPFSAPDQRLYQRHRLKAMAFMKLGESNGGVVLDISEGGVAVRAAVALSGDFLPRIRFQLPPDRQWFETSGRVVRLDDSRTLAGIEFVDLPREAATRINEWISAHATREASSGATPTVLDKTAQLLETLSLREQLEKKIAESIRKPAPPSPTPAEVEPPVPEVTPPHPPVLEASVPRTPALTLAALTPLAPEAAPPDAPVPKAPAPRAPAPIAPAPAKATPVPPIPVEAAPKPLETTVPPPRKAPVVVSVTPPDDRPASVVAPATSPASVIPPPALAAALTSPSPPTRATPPATPVRKPAPMTSVFAPTAQSRSTPASVLSRPVVGRPTWAALSVSVAAAVLLSFAGAWYLAGRVARETVLGMLGNPRADKTPQTQSTKSAPSVADAQSVPLTTDTPHARPMSAALPDDGAPLSAPGASPAATSPSNHPVPRSTAPSSTEQIFDRNATTSLSRSGPASRDAGRGTKSLSASTTTAALERPSAPPTITPSAPPAAMDSASKPAPAREIPVASAASVSNPQPLPAAPSAEARQAPPSTAKPPETAEIYKGAVSVSYSPYPSIRIPPDLKSQASRAGASLQIGQLLSRVDPVYPEDAERQRIEGAVKLHVVIGREGAVQDVQVINGSPSLAPAAMSALRQWRFKQTLFAGQPIEAEEDVTVNFRMTRQRP